MPRKEFADYGKGEQVTAEFQGKKFPARIVEMSVAFATPKRKPTSVRPFAPKKRRHIEAEDSKDGMTEPPSGEICVIQPGVSSDHGYGLQSNSQQTSLELPKLRLSDSMQRWSVLSWINYLYVLLGSLPVWPRRQTVDSCMPTVFKDRYAATRIILDCTELHMQRPSSLKLNTEFYSHYKSTTTLKGLVGIIPSVAVSLVSALHPGSVSDNAITRNSGILELLENGDQVMVNKGFKIEGELAKAGATLVISPFLTATRPEFTKQEGDIHTSHCTGTCAC
ncbi:hypothetical protein LSH36_969g00025 [Paralvinella palmiformis]|uniref:DDE Tnp4 domain-containing protein n=1 Tax=Paralvinella palmiformis TaxID=53620 RepID=A0AAD9IWU8_9ANNE|nr:hypothetical protein LSH36_969g00025 [Paralvinella palmiformis]